MRTLPKLILFVLPALFTGLSTLAQTPATKEKLNKFIVTDSITRKPVASSLVAIVRAKLAITTEKDGIFIIPGDLKKLNDTVIISSQGYLPYKILLQHLDGMDTLRLSNIPVESISVNFDDKETQVLNPFKRKEVTHYAGLHTENTTFDYLQLAQQFYLPKSGARLKRIQITRLFFLLDWTLQYDYMATEHTTFRVRVYDADTLKGGPGKELCNQIIEIKSMDEQHINHSLEKYNIIIPNKSFFVAVEWMRDFNNQGYEMVFDPKTMSYKRMVNFKPAIGMSPHKGEKQNIWGLNTKRQWQPYTNFSPDFTDLAISAVVAQ
ncbi:MAG: hypothetical protein EOO92_05035 [Pedobacter sp.]|nr:MAG: hypothetical protein EOO92_05035 [Pedobacter sp.]